MCAICLVAHVAVFFAHGVVAVYVVALEFAPRAHGDETIHAIPDARARVACAVTTHLAEDTVVSAHGSIARITCSYAHAVDACIAVAHRTLPELTGAHGIFALGAEQKAVVALKLLAHTALVLVGTQVAHECCCAGRARLVGARGCVLVHQLLQVWCPNPRGNKVPYQHTGCSAAAARVATYGRHGGYAASRVVTLLVLVELTECFVEIGTERVVTRRVTDGTNLAPAAVTGDDAPLAQRVLVTLGTVTLGAQVVVANGAVGWDAICTRSLLAVDTTPVAFRIVCTAVACEARLALGCTVDAQDVLALLTREGARGCTAAGWFVTLATVGCAGGAVRGFAVPTPVRAVGAHVVVAAAHGQVLLTAGVVADATLGVAVTTHQRIAAGCKAPPLGVARTTQHVVAAVCAAHKVLLECVFVDEGAVSQCVDASGVDVAWDDGCRFALFARDATHALHGVVRLRRTHCEASLNVACRYVVQRRRRPCFKSCTVKA